MRRRADLTGTLIGLLALSACASEIASPSATPSPTDARPGPTATRAPSLSPTPVSDPITSQVLRDGITAAAIRMHLDALQRIADAHGGNRATGTPGFEASVAYVAGSLEAAGYEVERQQFDLDGGNGVNLIAERRGAGPEVVIFGAHLDSGPVGPGINDNGSGVGTILELAVLLADLDDPERTVRFAFWDAEEPGLHGSRAYLAALDPEEREEIAAYLNFDMLGSPNHIRFVYDEAVAAPGSDVLTELFAAHFDSVGLAWAPIDLTGHADHGPFIAAGIPTGGLFSGGFEPKTDAQAALFGGSAGLPADPCSHRACDTIANVSDAALDEMADAIADALALLASGHVRPRAP